jgi:WD40 repeat protein
MPTATRTFRVFVSSTFEDLKAERDALQRQVFPRLRKLCEANNARFQAIDLRWGVRDEAALDQQTMEICLREIERCRQTGIKPNFIVLLGERYGWLPLPARIEAGEFEKVRDRAADADKPLIDDWYERDDNAVPPEFLLKARSGEYADKDRWGEVEQRLHRILREAAREAGLPEESLIRYEASATHQEILNGLGQSEEDLKHVFAFFREPAFGVVEDSKLAALKDELRRKLPEGNVHPFSANEIDRLYADVEVSLSSVILAEAGKFTARPALDLEIEAHDKFALHRVRHFTGRQGVLDAMGEHIRGGESRPLVVHGASGCGKSAIMAKAAELAKEAMPGAALIQRFIGVTPDASSGVPLLSSLCQQLSSAYDVTEETPIGFQPLVEAFHRRMARATAGQPLVLFLDALDQLRSDDEARSFTWLHQNLPPHVSLIVSTTEIPAGLRNAAETLVEEFPANEAEQVLTAWLTDAKRKLQTEQRQRVLGGFAQSGLPLYLKLAFEEARRWRSFDAAESCVLGSDVGAMIDVLFSRLSEESNHGPILVIRSLGYLAAARYGLTEDEMLDVLTADDAVWSDFDQRKHHEVSERRLPVVVWSRLSLDLESYFTERATPGGNVISFFHRQFAERVAERFLAGDETQARHADLARHFSAKPVWLDEGRKTPNARRAAELVFQQRGARQWAEAEATLFDCPFLFAKVAAGMVLDLDGDYGAVLQDAPESELRDRDTLRLIQGTLRLSLHVVAKDPGQFASQMRGRLLAHQAKPGVAAFLNDLDVCTPLPRLRPLWPTLKAAGGPMLRILEGHTDCVRAVALSADGKRAVSGSGDNTLRVWDLEGNQVPRILEGHTDEVYGVALSADGKRAVSGSRDFTVRVWDLEGNQPPRILEGHTDWVLAMALSADGKRAVSGSRDSTVLVWDLEGNQPSRLLEGHTGSVNAVALSADGKRVVSGSDDCTVRVWDLEGNLPPRILRGHTICVNAVALSADGKRAVSGSWDHTLRVWDLEGNQPPRILEGHTDLVCAVALSRDGKRAISGSDDCTVRVWDLEGNRPPRVLEGHTDQVNAVALSANSKCAVSGSGGFSGDYSVRVWDLEGNQPSDLQEDHKSCVNTVALSTDGKRAVSGSEDYTVRVWDLEGNRSPRILEGHRFWVRSVAISAGGKRAVSGSDDRTLRVWDLEGNQPPRILEGHMGGVRAVAISADGKRAISGSDDKTLQVWDLESRQPPRILESNMDWVWAVALSGNGRHAVSGYPDGNLLVWNLEGNQPPSALEGHAGSVRAVALSANGKRAVSGSDDMTLRVWDLQGNQPPLVLEGHMAAVNAVALSGDGKRAVSGSDDHTVRVWGSESGMCLAVFTCDAQVTCCAWARDWIVAGDRSGHVHLFAWEE